MNVKSITKQVLIPLFLFSHIFAQNKFTQIKDCNLHSQQFMQNVNEDFRTIKFNEVKTNTDLSQFLLNVRTEAQQMENINQLHFSKHTQIQEIVGKFLFAFNNEKQNLSKGITEQFCFELEKLNKAAVVLLFQQTQNQQEVVDFINQIYKQLFDLSNQFFTQTKTITIIKTQIEQQLESVINYIQLIKDKLKDFFEFKENPQFKLFQSSKSLINQVNSQKDIQLNFGKDLSKRIIEYAKVIKSLGLNKKFDKNNPKDWNQFLKDLISNLLHFAFNSRKNHNDLYLWNINLSQNLIDLLSEDAKNKEFIYQLISFFKQMNTDPKNKIDNFIQMYYQNEQAWVNNNVDINQQKSKAKFYDLLNQITNLQEVDNLRESDRNQLLNQFKQIALIQQKFVDSSDFSLQIIQLFDLPFDQNFLFYQQLYEFLLNFREDLVFQGKENLKYQFVNYFDQNAKINQYIAQFFVPIKLQFARKFFNDEDFKIKFEHINVPNYVQVKKNLEDFPQFKPIINITLHLLKKNIGKVYIKNYDQFENIQNLSERDVQTKGIEEYTKQFNFDKEEEKQDQRKDEGSNDELMRENKIGGKETKKNLVNVINGELPDEIMDILETEDDLKIVAKKIEKTMENGEEVENITLFVERNESPCWDYEMLRMCKAK